MLKRIVLVVVALAAIAAGLELVPTASLAQHPTRFSTQTISKGKLGLLPVGVRLEAPGPAIRYRWLRCNRAGRRCRPIAGATHRFYIVRMADLGHRLRVRFVQGNTVATSAATAQVGRPLPINTAIPVITDGGPGTLAAPLVGDVLVGSQGTWKYAKSFTYQWQDCDVNGANCVAITGATTTSYTLADSDVSFTIRFVVTAYNY